MGDGDRAGKVIQPSRPTLDEAKDLKKVRARKTDGDSGRRSMAQFQAPQSHPLMRQKHYGQFSVPEKTVLLTSNAASHEIATGKGG
ncbi:hypothetical protein MMC12_002364 [Toensbergia leucococca]|nr:hypothetical protein [Toensbergia leucococca]